MSDPEFPDFSIRRLGEARLPSPIALGSAERDGAADFVTDDQRVAFGIELSVDEAERTLGSRGLLEKAGPRARIYFDPAKVQDKATYEKPHQYSEGFDLVLVNGVPVVENGKVSGARPGKVLRHQ